MQKLSQAPIMAMVCRCSRCSFNERREKEEEEPAEPKEGEEGEENEGDDEDIKIEDMSVEELKDLIRDIVAQETGEEEGMEDELPADDSEAGDMTGMEDGEEEIDINELLRELEEGSHEDKMDEYGSSTMKEPSALCSSRIRQHYLNGQIY
jgi:hypothetical protein